MDNIKILELFGGIGSPRCALRNIGIPVKAIDYVEIDEKAVRSYNAMFADQLLYKPQSVIGWDLKPDILIHGSPCQDFSIAGHQKGADEGSETRSSLMWETVHIIQKMGEWKPKYVIWENVKNVRSKHMIANHNRYLKEMRKLGYTNSFEILDARDFGLPQRRERVFTISILGKEIFDFSDLIKTPMKDIKNFLQNNDDVPSVYDVTQPSVYNAIGKTGIKRATVIQDCAYTITTRQDRTPAQVIDCGNGRYRYLTELECWRLQGYTDEDFFAAASVHLKKGRYCMPLYKQAGNSIPVTIFESIFRKILLNQTHKKIRQNENLGGREGKMKQLDIFGKETDINSICENINIKKERTIKGKFRSAYGYDKRNRCKECQHHIVLHYNDKNFHKCKMIGISHSSATDIRLKDHACKLFVEEVKENE